MRMLGRVVYNCFFWFGIVGFRISSVIVDVFGELVVVV